MGKAKEPLLEVGDKVLWKGIPLTVIKVFPDGSAEATSQTMRVFVGAQNQFEKLEKVKE